jgi:hypothetical protein
MTDITQGLTALLAQVWVPESEIAAGWKPPEVDPAKSDKPGDGVGVKKADKK